VSSIPKTGDPFPGEPLLSLVDRFRQQMLDSLTEAMADDCVSDAERLGIMEHLESKFCRGCGVVLNGKTCHCSNDE
jgi:hypothetical protein